MINLPVMQAYPHYLDTNCAFNPTINSMLYRTRASPVHSLVCFTINIQRSSTLLVHLSLGVPAIASCVERGASSQVRTQSHWANPRSVLPALHSPQQAAYALLQAAACCTFPAQPAEHCADKEQHHFHQPRITQRTKNITPCRVAAHHPQTQMCALHRRKDSLRHSRI